MTLNNDGCLVFVERPIGRRSDVATSRERTRTARRLTRTRRSKTTQRRGAAAVEFAFVAVLVILMVFSMVEFGRALMCVNSLEEAARSACRIAVLDGSTKTEVEDEVARMLATTGIDTYTVTLDPTDLSTAGRWQGVTVSVDAAFADMTWMPAPNFLSGMTYTASCTLPREAGTN